MTANQRIDILGVQVSAVNLSLAQACISDMIARHQRGYVCVAPVSTIVDCQRIDGYRQVVNQAAMVTPDGMPVVWLCQMKGARHAGRSYGPDLMAALCQRAGLRHFFYGGSSQVLEALKEKLTVRYPSIQIAGMYAPEYSPQANVECSQIIDMINASQADIVWVALGSPKQDFWMHKNRALLNVPVLIGVGAAFDFISGAKPQAPKWMQKSGLEWLFRLCCEPKRLWKRYLIGNLLFVFYLLRDCFKRK